jgi:hypothetical protein
MFAHICAKNARLRPRKLDCASARNLGTSLFGAQPMQPHEWMTKCEHCFVDPVFKAFVRDQLAAIHNATTTQEKARFAGRFGGYLRSLRSAARLELAEALMRELAIARTQHVAYMLMKQAFGEAAETATLDRFAKPGRDASEKHMEEARVAAAAQPRVLARYAGMYHWYVERLALHIARLKGSRTRPRPRPGPGGGARRSTSKGRPQLRRVK